MCGCGIDPAGDLDSFGVLISILYVTLALVAPLGLILQDTLVLVVNLGSILHETLVLVAVLRLILQETLVFLAVLGSILQVSRHLIYVSLNKILFTCLWRLVSETRALPLYRIFSGKITVKKERVEGIAARGIVKHTGWTRVTER